MSGGVDLQHLYRWRSRTPTSPRTSNGSASSGPPASWCRRRPWRARGPSSTGATPRRSGGSRDCVGERAVEPARPRSSGETGEAPEPRLPDFRAFAESVLDWNFSPRAYAGTDETPIPPELEAALPEAGTVLRPDFAVRSERLPNAPRPAAPGAVRVSTPATTMPESPPTATVQGSTPTATVHGSTPAAPLRESAPAAKPRQSAPAGAVRESPLAYGPSAGPPDWQLLVCKCRTGDDFDRAGRAADGLDASPHGRLERLLRHTGVPAGLLFNGVAVRLVSAPRGESSGWLDFRVADMLETSGRPIAAALRLLLGQTRLLLAPRAKRLAALLADSRRHQNDVSERLAEQVLHALYELLRGLQAAHDASRGALLREPLADRPDEVYRALLAVLLRLVFLLYAEQRDMLPDDDTYTPRALTEPIVREALAPVLDRLRTERGGALGGAAPRGGPLHEGAPGGGRTGGGVPGGGRPGDGTPPPGPPLLPDQILNLKICDPAMGSGAFLVEACRQLGDQLGEAWGAHGGRPADTAGEDDVTAARRLVAQRCLYPKFNNPKSEGFRINDLRRHERASGTTNVRKP